MPLSEVKDLGSSSNYAPKFPHSAKGHTERQQMMFEGSGSWPPMWDKQIEFLLSGFGVAPDVIGNRRVNGRWELKICLTLF